jgi:hypothetical protein
VATLRGWERTGHDVAMPRPKSGLVLIEIAKRNNYPLTFNEMREYVDEKHLEAIA